MVDSATEQSSSGASFASPTSGSLFIGYANTVLSGSEFAGQMAELRVWKSRSVSELLAYSHT